MGDIYYLIKYGKHLDDLRMVSVGDAHSNDTSRHGILQEHRMSPFQLASFCNNTKAMRELLKQGVNINQRGSSHQPSSIDDLRPFCDITDDSGYTAIERACQAAVSAIETLAEEFSQFFDMNIDISPLGSRL